MLKLTKIQQEIVDYLDGSLLVTAGPGSGKTRVLTQRIANIVDRRQGKVLALTFSNKAAEEISERIKEQISSDNFSRVQAGTIHSFCLDIITNKGSQIGLPSGLTVIESIKDKLELLKKGYNNFNNVPQEKELRMILSQIQYYKQNFISPEVAKIQGNLDDSDIIDIYESYNNLLIVNRVIDFDDILFYAYRILVERPRVARNFTRLYKYILIDEAQDLNETQYKIIKALTIDFNNLMMVGDSAQSIYGFNGSNSSIMTDRFVEDYKPEKFFLTENFRSTSNIIEAANKIQPESKSRSVFPLEGKLEVHSFEDEEAEAMWIENQIDLLLTKGSNWVDHEIKLDNIVVIGRNRYLFEEIEKIFQRKEIKYSIGGASSNLECETLEMKVFETGLRVLANQNNDLHYGQVNSYLKRDNKTNNFLQDLLNNREVYNSDLNINIISSVIDAWNILSKEKEGFSKALKEIERVIESLSNLDENFQFLIQNDINLWKDRWNKYCKQSVTGERSLAHFRNQVSLGTLNTNNSSGISLLTVHMSKGLEYDIVFILGLTQGTFPDYRAKSLEQKKEEQNNMFVAITRAKRECYLTYPMMKMMPWGSEKKQNPSEYLSLIE